jgi:aspartate kinase
MKYSMPLSMKPSPELARPIVVQKYGGSSLADVERLRRVAERVVASKRAGNDVVVVVSAMGKTTDGLLELAAKVSMDPPRRELDMLVSTGERVAMALMSIAIQAHGCDAISFTGSQCGIITNDRHFDARIIEVRPHRIEDELARGRIVIVAGYQGMSYRREITTLGRGGSDTTAVALAAALRAERCEIYSDVDGVYSADPRSVPEARHLPEVDYTMLEEMASAGAKVLCAQAVEWARRAGISIHARSTFDDRDPPAQTIVRAVHPSEQPRARAVVRDPRVALLEVAPDSLERVLEVLAACRLSVADLAAAGGGLSLTLSLVNAPDWPAARRALESRALGARIDEEVARLSVVGVDLGDRPEVLSRFTRLLREAGASSRALAGGPLGMRAVVPRAQSEEAERLLHAGFAG